MGFNMINGVFYATTYHPIQAGSIDGTDIAPHDNGVYRALLASSTGLCMLSLFLSLQHFAFHVTIAWVGSCVIKILTIDRDMCLLDMWQHGQWKLDFLLKHRYVNRLSLIRTSIGINFGWKIVRRWSTWWSQSRGRPLLLSLCWPPFTSNGWEDPSWGMCPNYFDYHLKSLLRIFFELPSGLGIAKMSLYLVMWLDYSEDFTFGDCWSAGYVKIWSS